MNYRDAAFPLLRELPGVAIATVVDAMREITSEFCRETLLWRETERSVLIPGINRYMVGGGGSEAIYIFSVQLLNGQNIAKGKVPILSGEAVITPPSEMVQVDIEMALTLPFGSEAENIPEALIPYIDALLFGTKWKLKSMNHQPWADSAGADLAYRQYRNRIEDALHSLHATPRVKPRAFV